jgi:tetratricopeptide (TPR) repeat protein
VPAGGKRADSTVKHTIFLSYSSAQGEIAARIELALKGEGHAVFRDRSSLPPGESFDERIRNAIEESDLLVFLISRDSVAAGRYTLTELKFAEQKWPHPGGRVLPVYAEETPKDTIPAYLRAVTNLRPRGNLVAEVAAEVDRMTRPWWRRMLEPKRLVPAVILALLVAGSAWMWLPSYFERREQNARADTLMKQSRSQADSGNYADAWKLLEQAGDAAPTSRDVVAAQEKLAMEVLRGARSTHRVGSRSSHKGLVNMVAPVLSRGVSEAKGERLANLLAHRGWADYLLAPESREAFAGIDPAPHYRRALEADPRNVYAHAMLGFEILRRRGALAEANQHFSAALETGRERDYVRYLQISALLQLENPEWENEAIRVANEMRRQGEPRPQGWGGFAFIKVKLWHVYSEALIENRQKPRFLAALPPAEHLALFSWLFPEDEPQRGSEDYWLFQRRYCLAQLQEHNGDRSDALATYRLLLSGAAAKKFDSAKATRMIGDANAAIKRLAG